MTRRFPWPNTRLKNEFTAEKFDADFVTDLGA